MVPSEPPTARVPFNLRRLRKGSVARSRPASSRHCKVAWWSDLTALILSIRWNEVKDNPASVSLL